MLGNPPSRNRDIFLPAHSVAGIFAVKETVLTIKKPKTMKRMNKIMLIAFMALMMIPMPQQAAAALERKPKVNIEKRERKPQRKPVNLRAMRDSDFSMMYKIVKEASFDKNKINIIRVACIASNFSSKQCARLLALLSFDDNKLEALKVMAPRLVEFDNYNKILNQFSFSSSREKAAKILLKR